MIYIRNTPTKQDALPTILYTNTFEQGTMTATTEAVGYPKENILTENTNKAWRPTAVPARMTVDFGTAVSVDSFAIIGHNLGTGGNTVVIQSSPDGVTWTTRSTSMTPTDDTTILGLFTALAERYWRLNISAGAIPTISRFILTTRFNLPAGVRPPYNPVWLSQSYDLLTSTTLGGQFLGNKVFRQGGETSINLVALHRAYAESDLLPFREHYNLGKAFIWAAGPSIFPNDVGYVWRKENSIMKPTFDVDGLFMSVGMEVYAYGK